MKPQRERHVEGEEPLEGLDPQDWPAFRAQAHEILDHVIDYVEGIRERPVWQPLPDAERALIRGESLPRRGVSLREVHAQFNRLVVPYTVGNVHPGFMAWVHGGGNVFGMLGELLASGLNANLGGRDHAPIEVERLVVRWAADLFGFPEAAGGVLVTGTSMANLMAVLAARTHASPQVKQRGVSGPSLVAYTSAAAHGCIARAMDMSGLGVDALRVVPVGADHRLCLSALSEAIERDRAVGLRPFLVVATAGTVETGAIDDLVRIGELCSREALWFHIDGAFGALGMLSRSRSGLFRGIERADSVAFDFHKWGQVPYDAGCLVVRDQAVLLRTFAAEQSYLRRESRGLAAGAPWPCDLGPDLSRGFRALKVWFTLKVIGADRLGAAIDLTCDLASELGRRVDAEADLERIAPIALNIVCFRYRFARHIDRENAALAIDLQLSGMAATSTATIDGKLALRCAIFNHRTRRHDIDAMIDTVLELGRARARRLAET
ncbi:MAG: cytochrome ubiquinol oxidase subunit [Myxococcaceae bacterium]|nr:cytochrome ubiquinol oxidase subunit [Myxococcaceae bacterium]